MAKSNGFKFLGFIFLLMGIKVQRPVRRIKRGRSFKYSMICKLLAGHGKGRRKSKFGKKRTTYKRRGGR